MTKNMLNEEFAGKILVEGFDLEKMQALSEEDKHWKDVIIAHQNKMILQSEVKGIEHVQDQPCAILELGRIRVLIPLEMAGVPNLDALRSLTGKKIAFRIHSYDREADVVIGSRKDAIDQMAAITMKYVKKDDIIIAVVQNVKQKTMVVDVGGIRSTIPFGEVRYGWVEDLRTEFKVGDHLNVKVLDKDEEKKELIVSARALQENPWERKAKLYKVGSEYVGRVSGTPDYGIFINLSDGVDSFSQHLKYQSVVVGDKVLVRVQNVNPSKEQISVKIVKIL